MVPWGQTVLVCSRRISSHTAHLPTRPPAANERVAALEAEVAALRGHLEQAQHGAQSAQTLAMPAASVPSRAHAPGEVWKGRL